jgi:hypothetical protein
MFYSTSTHNSSQQGGTGAIASSQGAMVMNVKDLWIWFMAGLVPHHVRKQQSRYGFMLEIQALFWSLRYDAGEWTISLTLLKWLRHSIWTAVINENIIWIWCVAGMIPYHFKKQQAKGKLTLEIQALFWSLRYAAGKWAIQIPLIERLRNVNHDTMYH